eukprot:gene4346-5438_t
MYSNDSELSYLEGKNEGYNLTDQTLNQILDEQVKRFPNKKALIVPKENISLTYKEFQHQVACLCASLIDLGFRKGDHIAKLVTPSYVGILMYYALAKIGIVSINLHPIEKETSFHRIMTLTKCKGIFLENGIDGKDNHQLLKEIIPELNHEETKPGKLNSEKYPNLKLVVSILDSGASPSSMLSFKSVYARGEELIRNGFQLEEYESLVLSKEPSQIIFTSGSTGEPKMVLHTQYLFVNNNIHLAQKMALDENDVFGSICPSFYGLARAIVSAVFSVGATLVFLVLSPDITEILESIEKYSISAINGTPISFSKMIDHPDFKKYNIKSLKKGFVGNFNVPPKKAELYKQTLGIEQCITGWGMSECYFSFTTESNSSMEVFANTVGSIFPYCAAKVIDEDGEIVPIGQVGQLCIKSYTNMLEYFGDEKKTKETLVDGWLLTGDHVKFDRSGYCIFVSRISEYINCTGNKKVSAIEIENLLYNHPKVKETYVIGVPNSTQNSNPVEMSLAAWIIPNQNDSTTSPLTLEEIQTFCKEKNLPPYKIPIHIELVSKFPVINNNKPSKQTMQSETIKKLNLTPQ